MKPSFPAEERKRIEAAWSLFWQGRLNRPMVFMETADPAIPPEPRFRRYFQEYPAEMAPDEIMAIETRQMNRIRFIGDSLPKRFLNFGPGSMASVLGSRVEVGQDTVWFHPIGRTLREIQIRADRDGFWYRRIHSILDAALAAWGDTVQVSVSDIGGNLDTLASLRGTEDLLMDMIEEPDDVERLARDITREWLALYDEETVKLRAAGLGICPWAPIWSRDNCYMFQCDLSYMFSTDMFARFVVPDLETCCNHIPASFYHLDGKGALNHLDSLLAIKKIKGIQWIPGAGQPEASEWPEVLDKIRKAGKFCQISLTPGAALKLKETRDLSGFAIGIELPAGTGTEEAGRIYDKMIA